MVRPFALCCFAAVSPGAHRCRSLSAAPCCIKPPEPKPDEALRSPPYEPFPVFIYVSYVACEKIDGVEQNFNADFYLNAAWCGLACLVVLGAHPSALQVRSAPERELRPLPELQPAAGVHQRRQRRRRGANRGRRTFPCVQSLLVASLAHALGCSLRTRSPRTWTPWWTGRATGCPPATAGWSTASATSAPSPRLSTCTSSPMTSRSVCCVFAVYALAAAQRAVERRARHACRR